MDKKQFSVFCRSEFEKYGFTKRKNMFYLCGHDVLCGIYLQKSDYGTVYYIDYCYFIGDFADSENYPGYRESDSQGRIMVMSKKMSFQGKTFLTAQIEYEAYTEDELRPFFEKEFKEKVLPPIRDGRKFILENLDKLYFLTLNQEEVKEKLQG